MSVDDFIAAQLQVIRDDDFGEYLPTLWVETPRQVKVDILMDELEGGELEMLAREWAQKLAGKHNYFLAFMTDESHLKVVARVGTVSTQHVVAAKTH